MAEISKQWEKLTQDEFQHIDEEFLATFRAPGARNKFAAWDPFERSSRYFKFLLSTVASRESDEFFAAYRRLENRELGSPLTVRCGACDVDADYFAAVEEWDFLVKAGGLESTKSVVEIGAGFGRTCHTLLTLAPQIEQYTIVDLPPMLKLSEAYLARVVPGANVRFVSSDDSAAVESIRPDLAINIDSFQEMPPNVIDSYMRRIVAHAKRFYCKNPIGKYLPASIGLPDLSPLQLMDVFKIGYCQDVIDIFDEEVLTSARETYLRSYCPPGGEHSLVESKPMAMFPYFQHALYARDARAARDAIEDR